MLIRLINQAIPLIMLTISICFVSCKEEFLNVTPNHSLSEDDFYKSEDDFNQSVIAVYGDLQKYILKAHLMEEGRSDNTTYDNNLDGGSLTGSVQLAYMDQFKMTSSASIVSNAWTTIYSAIKDCNIPLAHLKTASIDKNVALNIEGQLRFLRGYFLFTAVRYWGDIPLITQPIITAEDAFRISRAPVEDVYKQIINDVKFADSVLPAKYTGADIGRITSGAAKTLLANIYMTQKNYAVAEKYLREIVNSQEYSLLPNYADIFNPSNKNNKESIFEVQFKEGSEGESSDFMYQFAPLGSRGILLVGPGEGDGLNLPTLNMVDSYELGDLRKDISIGYIIRGTDTVYYINKYKHDTDPNFSRTPDDWPIYRYADVILMLAEAINEQGYRTGEPFDLLNQVRNRAGLHSLTSINVPNQTIFRDTLLHERRVELAFENHRWFDLLRTGKAIEVMTAYGKVEMANPTTPVRPMVPYDDNSYKIDTHNLVYPIPVDELNKAPNLVQNPGY